MTRHTDDAEFLGHHLRYEVVMLQGTYSSLSKGGHDRIITNALIESFCIHARQLIEFFSNENGRKAKEFSGGIYVAKHLSELRPLIKKLNTQIAHLSGLRTADASKKIGPRERFDLLNALEKEAGHFASCLTNPHVGKFVAPPSILTANASGTAGATNQISATSSN